MVPIIQAREMVRASTKVCVLTGAGISTDSGIADFRGPNGTWTTCPDAQKLSTLTEFLSFSAVREQSWLMHAGRYMTTKIAKPNKGHRAIQKLGDKLHLLVTQNVDGLHHKAGTNPVRIVEAHGNLREVNCVTHCGYRTTFEEMEGELCPQCNSLLKPAVVFFGESLSFVDQLRGELGARTCDLLVAVGTTLQVNPVAGLTDIAQHSGARILIINNEPTQADHRADLVARGSISDILPFVFS